MMLFCVGFVVFLVNYVRCTIIKSDCPTNELHRSCSFFEEYTCWNSARQDERNLKPAKRLDNCRQGCFCKPGLVRNYPGGMCIMAHRCRDLHVLEVLGARYSRGEFD